MVNGFFQHTDGGFYRVKELSTSTVDQSTWVIYEHVWPFEVKTWNRPLEEWESRFTQISASVMLQAIENGNRVAAQAEITNKRKARKNVAADSAPTVRRTLEWEGPFKPTMEVRYDHAVSYTPFGRILITWKGWKEDPRFTVAEHPVEGAAYAGGGHDSLDDAKADAEGRYLDALAKAQEVK